MSNRLALKYLSILRPYTAKQLQYIFDNCLQIEQDGEIEFGEFIEIVCIIEQYPRRPILDLALIIKEVRTGVVCDTRSPRFGMPTKMKIPVMPEARRKEFTDAFRSLDLNRDGTIVLKELMKVLYA